MKKLIKNDADDGRRDRWLSILVGVLLSILMIALWWSLEYSEKITLNKKIKQESKKLLTNIQADMESRIQAFERMVSRWEVSGGFTKNEFISDGTNYAADMPGLKALEWIDSMMVIRWVVPESGNEKIIYLNPNFEDKRRHSLEQAKIKKRPVMTPPVELVQGGVGFVTYFPLYLKGEFDGFILAVCRIDEWMNYVLMKNDFTESMLDFNVLVSIDGEDVFTQASTIGDNYSGLKSTFSTDILNHKFSVTVQPTHQFIHSNGSLLPELVLFGGILLSWLVSFTIGLYQKITRQMFYEKSANILLEDEIRIRKSTEQDLKEASYRLSMATESGGIGVWTWNLFTNELIWDHLMFQIYDISPDIKPTYNLWCKSVYHEDWPKMEPLLEQIMLGNGNFTVEYRILTPSSEIRNIYSAARLKLNDKGEPEQVTGICMDISERKKTEMMLDKQRHRLEFILEGTNVGTWEWDIKTGVLTVNNRWAELGGYTVEELQPISIRTWIKLIHPDDFKSGKELLKKHFRGEIDYFVHEIRMRHKNGGWVWILERGRVSTLGENGRPLFMSGTHADINKRKMYEEKIEHLANFDELTKLPRRALASDRLSVGLCAAARNGHKIAIMFMDLDDFKIINDQYGHETGDKILQEVAMRIPEYIRKSDTVARLGGDEFLIIALDVGSKEGARKIAEKIIASISQPFMVDGKSLSVGSSIGIAMYPDDGDSSSELIRKSDVAMYVAKQNGKNSYAFVANEFA